MGLGYAPRHHETVTIRTTGRLGGMRVILTADGPLPSLVSYFMVPRNATKSPSWQSKVVQAVGLLYDYMQACPPTPQRLADGEYLSDFVRALSYGTVDEQGDDPTGLRWPAASRPKVIDTLRQVNAFTDWCAKTFGGAPANPLTAASYGERLAALHRQEIQNDNSLLVHLANARAVLAGDVDDDERTPFRRRAVIAGRPHKVVQKRPPFFPREYDPRLLTEGFARKRVYRGEFWERFIVREMMMALLHRYGGLRRSEALHICL